MSADTCRIKGAGFESAILGKALSLAITAIC